MFKVKTKSEFVTEYKAGVRDFQNIILTAVNLAGSNLEQINLSGSNLIEVNWSNCNLNRANLEGAYLGLSNFQNCCLSSVNFQQANLENANLKGANLHRANLKNACLTGAVYDSTTIFDPNFTPQTAGMILTDTENSVSESLKNIGDNCASESPKNIGAMQKIKSWYRSPFSSQNQARSKKTKTLY